MAFPISCIVVYYLSWSCVMTDLRLKKKPKNKTIKNAKTDCKKTENKFKKKKENIYISNELMHIIALILILEI